MPEISGKSTRPMGTVHTEKMLSLPGMLEFRLGMVHANGGHALEYTRRSVNAIIGHQAMSIDWEARKVVEDDLLIKSGTVGIISVDAPVFFAGSIWVALLGGVTVGEITKAVYAALNDPEIETVVLDMDCPGGQVAGIGELVEAIDALAASKTVVTYVHEMAASLAYWMASRTHRIVSNSSGEVGSIGAIAIAYDTSGWFREEGIRVIPLTEAEQKTFGHMGVEVTDSMVEREMTSIREIGAQFRASVAAKTGIEDAALMDLQGSMHYAGSALTLGLIDEVMTPSAFYTALHAGRFDGAGKKQEKTPSAGVAGTSPASAGAANTSGDAAAQNEVHTMSIDITSMTAEQKAELRAALAEDKKNDEEMEDEDDDETPASEDDKKEPKGEEDEDEPKSEDEDEDKPSAAMSFAKARSIIKPHKLPEAIANSIVIAAVEKNQSEAQVLSSVIAAINDPSHRANAELEAAAAGSSQAVGGGAGKGAGKGTGSAKARLESLANAEMKRDPSLASHEARRAVLLANPGLAQEMRNESREIRSKREAFSARSMQHA